jgi:hypothetical protein
MAITDKKIGSWTNPVVNEADQPQRTAAEMKAIFDANSNQIKAAFNAVIDELVGTGGAGNVGNGALGEIPAGTVAAQLAALLNMFGSYPSSSDIKGIRLSADNKIEVTLDGTTWKPTAQTGDPVTDLGALPVAADIQDADGFLMYDASEMKNKRTLWSKIKEAIGAVFAAGTVGDKYTISLEPDTADNTASIIRIKENATGNTRVLIAANTADGNNEVSQIVLRDGTNVGKINIQCNTSGAKGIRITDGNNVERIKLHHTTTGDTCIFEIKDASGNDITRQVIGAAPALSTPAGGTASLTLADNTEYRFTSAVTSLTLTFPSGNFDCWLEFTTGSSISVNFPANATYLGGAPTFEASKTYEMSIKDGSVICAEVEGSLLA